MSVLSFTSFLEKDFPSKIERLVENFSLGELSFLAKQTHLWKDLSLVLCINCILKF